MVSPDKQSQALSALHRLICHARTMALTGETQEAIAKVLDWTELLPVHLAHPQNRTAEFETAPRGAAEGAPTTNWILESFLKLPTENPPRSRELVARSGH